MAQIQIGVNLTQEEFPFNPNNFVDTELRDTGFEQKIIPPQVFYLQNCLPMSRGYTSVHYARVISDSSYPIYMDKILQLRNDLGEVALLSPAQGQNLVYTAVTGEWRTNAFPSPATGAVSIAYLKGKTYLCYAGLGLYSYDFGAQELVEETVTGGISFTDIIGVTAAGSYLILYTKTYFVYSSPLDPLDFTPALGAGGQSKILANRGIITTILPISNGVIVHTTVNSIAAQLSGNVNFPFTFREIPNSAGVEDSEHVTYDSTNDVHIALTTSGLMQISVQRAQLILPELSELIANKRYPVVATEPTTAKTDNLSVKISSIGTRYVVVSLKATVKIEFDMAYVYDAALNRWGTINIPHIDLFEYRAPEFTRLFTYDELTSTYDTYTQVYDALGEKITSQAAKFGATFGCVGKLGGVYVALAADYADVQLLESPSAAATPRIVFGKFRVVRRQGAMVHHLDINNIYDGIVAVYGHDLGGRMVKTKELVQSSRSNTTFLGRLHGSSVSFGISGRFSLSHVTLTCEPQASGLQVVAAAELTNESAVVVDEIPVAIDGEEVVLT